MHYGFSHHGGILRGAASGSGPATAPLPARTHTGLDLVDGSASGLAAVVQAREERRSSRC